MINDKSQQLTPSATLAVAAKAGERQQSGLPVFNLSVGEPDAGTPAHINEAAIKAIESGFTRYTAAGGTLELKEAILHRNREDKELDYSVAEVTCANGGKQILFNLFQILLNPGDEVLVADPAWVSYKTQIEWAGGVCTRIETPAAEAFQLSAEQVEGHITSKTRAIVLNSPSNPTGAILPKEELKKIADLCLRKEVFVISDEVYDHFYYGEEPPLSILQLKPELKAQAVLVNSVSKTYAMTGWRLGYALGPADLIAKMQSLQSQSASNPCSISQKAAIAALTGPQERIEEMRLTFAKRRQYLLDRLAGSKIATIPPDGAFYMMLNLTTLLKEDESDVELCTRILEETGVALVPGSAFGKQSNGWARLSFAASQETLETAMDALLSIR